MIPLLLLPNFLFLVPIVPASAAASPSPSTGQPLPPGTVKAQNTWNLTQTCPKATSPSEPLATEQSGWSATLHIPTLLFMGSPQGNYITQSYSVSSNGTFSVSDDLGNSFSFDVPVSASGTAATTLVGNSTMAVQETRVTSGLATAADVKLTYSVYDQTCQPAGIRLAVTGSENWGTSNAGSIRLTFNKKPVSVVGDRAYFGNTSGIALGFDWSDSSSLNPTFNSTSSTLSYEVGSTFSIDPVTVGTSSGADATAYSTESHVFYTSGRYWVFYFDGTSEGYSTSTNGLSWTTETSMSIAPASGCGGSQFIAFFISGQTVYYAWTNNGGTIYYRYGTLTSGGSITWSISQSSFTISGNAQECSTPGIAVDTNGHLWVAISNGSGVEV